MIENEDRVVDAARQGNAKAFELLVITYQGRIRALLSRWVRNAAEVDELSQEVFLRAYRGLPNFRGDSSFFTWIYRIAINLAKNHLQTQKRRPQIADVEIADAEQFDFAPDLRTNETPERTHLRRELLDQLEEAVEALPEVLRRAVELRELDGKSYEEIAEILDCPIGTVRSRLFRGRQEIERRMRPYLQKGQAGERDADLKRGQYRQQHGHHEDQEHRERAVEEVLDHS
ncbi:MAG: RNA polymerase sigma factor RpoE [Alphaproteobacteria bacterium CG_4_10_14_0_2_um_filter_63_37]|nr:MAG: RNA polymerase sigma factor RpoE [Proteobacteria bacterium CG1_02_64_396]PJA23753.1 MAG: RNA polymerase sigma factor RpoE [Alphaproteobacteria bacterium CG_4_10_14_0_2_um_filter_63_37]